MTSIAKTTQNTAVSDEQLEELLHQALETEKGGAEIYRAALECVQNADLRKEWTKYLAQTERHVEKLEEVFEALELDPNRETPGRSVVRQLGASLVGAIRLARANGESAAAELVAAECVTLAETKDHLNWKLLSKLAEQLSGDGAEILRAACEEVEGEEDEHLYHTAGWARELWLAALGLEAELPPPEEVAKVKSAMGAARAQQAHGR